jgi:predicted Zn-dependent peptidase
MIKTFRLPNGVTGVTEDRPNSGKVSMQITFKSGSADESAAENGLTSLMRAAMNASTTTRSRLQLADAVESKGGSIGTGMDATKTYFTSTALTRYAAGTFSALADMVRHPAFVPGEIAQEKMLLKQKILQQVESPFMESSLKFFEAALDQVAGSNVLGTPALVDSFTPGQIRQRHAELLAHPENMIVSFTGDIDAATAEKLTREAFGDLPPAAQAAKETPLQFKGGDIREEADTAQLNLTFGFKAPAANDADRYAAMMLKEYLSGGMSSSLFTEIREKRGLAYTVGADYLPLPGTGVFTVIAGTGKGNAGELIPVAMDQFGKVIRDGVSQDQLDRMRAHIVRSLQGASENANASATRNTSQIMDFGRAISPEETDALLKSVTSDDIRRVAANMIKDGKYALGAVGPQDTMPTEAQIKDMMQAQVKDVTIPAATPVKPVISGKFNEKAKKETAAAAPKITTLANGMKVVTIERPGTLSVGALVGVGSDDETRANNGSSHMFEHMPFKGTTSYGPGQIAKIVSGEMMGGNNAYTSKDKTVFYLYNLGAADLAKAVKITGEMVFYATLDPAEFDGKMLKNKDGTVTKAKGERDVVIEELKRSNDNLDEAALELAEATAYPGQSHGRDTIGTEQTLRAMTVESLKAYRDEHYAPNDVIFSATGPIKHEDFVKLVEKAYGQMPGKNVPALPTPVYKGGTAYIEDKNASLCRVFMAAEGVSDSDPDRKAYEALGQLLGGAGYSRFGNKIVVEQQLTNEVGAEPRSYQNAGEFFTYTSGIEAKNVRPFISSIYAEMRKLDKTLTQAELDKVKAAMEMNLLTSAEKNSDANDVYAGNVQTYGRIMTPAEQSKEIQNVSIDDIRRVLKKVLASNPTVAMVVPPGTDPRYLPKQADVVAMRDGKAPQSKIEPKI